MSLVLKRFMYVCNHSYHQMWFKIDSERCTRQICDIIQCKRTVFYPQVQEPLIVTHSWLAGLNSNRHNLVMPVDLAASTKAKKETLSHPIKDSMSNKIMKITHTMGNWKHHLRRRLRMASTSFKRTMESNKKPFYFNFLRERLSKMAGRQADRFPAIGKCNKVG